MNYSYTEELKLLLNLVKFKDFQRYGMTLYAKYDTLKAECTIGELVWGWCKNPCFANRLIADLEARIPNCERYTSVLSKANRLIETSLLNDTFDGAMRQVCKKGDNKALLAYSNESTSIYDIHSDELGFTVLNGTDEDGEMWHGLQVSRDPAEWEGRVDSVIMTIYSQQDNQKVTVWTKKYSRSAVLKHTKTAKDVRMFCPFKHPMILLNLNITVECLVKYQFPPSEDPKQVFGIASNDLCNWLMTGIFETKISEGVRALVDMPNGQISFRQ
jgi:hypothetical protein